MNLWNEKAKTYTRYQEKLDNIQKQSFKEFSKLGIDFFQKNIIDIGCGTGIWTLHLAKKAKMILALDSANAMLEILKEYAKNLKLKNIVCENSSFTTWAQKNPNAQFDIAFLSMSPALKDKKDYEKFLNLAQTKIYLAWTDRRKSDFLDPIFKHFNTQFQGFYKKDLENYLLEKNIPFHKAIFNQTRKIQRKREEAIENALWHLKMNGIVSSKEELYSFINEDVIETIKAKIKLLIIQ
ncbi:methyltransferase domain-containing protein [Campylobacter hepaticus]|uniref:class I SAM-dependent methyltransferase n=1 Tax=Campylobacter bilis TaxID=2691918 RepID=UPI00130D7DE8|nr:class I SAM-dependent methyltransferase [Campylobacter bilis]MBM0636427.1 methyltransferase domain-containing protein [Campylobacter bilis]MPV62928.1 methyltransferase domain-containing protein [Campylobacter hepaticus]